MIPNNVLNDCTGSRIDAVEITGKATAIVPGAVHATVADIQAVLNKLPKNAEIVDIDFSIMETAHTEDAANNDVRITVVYAASQAVENNLTATYRDICISTATQAGNPLTQSPVPFRKDI